MGEVELGRGTTPLPAGLQAEAVTIADQSPGSYRVELRGTSVDDVEAALAPFRARSSRTE